MKKLVLNRVKEGQYKTQLLRLLPFSWLDSEGLVKRRFLSCWEVGSGAESIVPGATHADSKESHCGVTRICHNHLVKQQCSREFTTVSFPGPVLVCAYPYFLRQHPERCCLLGRRAHVPVRLCPSLYWSGHCLNVSSRTGYSRNLHLNDTVRVISLFVSFETNLSPMVLATSGHT